MSLVFCSPFFRPCVFLFLFILIFFCYPFSRPRVCFYFSSFVRPFSASVYVFICLYLFFVRPFPGRVYFYFSLVFCSPFFRPCVCFYFSLVLFALFPPVLFLFSFCSPFSRSCVCFYFSLVLFAPFCTRIFTSLPFCSAFSIDLTFLILLSSLPVLTVCTSSALYSYQCHSYATLKLLTLSPRSFIFNPPFFFARSLSLHIICIVLASQFCDSENS